MVIGVLGPNDAIRGRGELRLRDAGIEVARFDSDLMAQIEEPRSSNFVASFIGSRVALGRPSPQRARRSVGTVNTLMSTGPTRPARPSPVAG